MSSTASTSKPAETSAKPAEKQKTEDVQHLGVLEEDDEFEEFECADWDDSHTDLAHLGGAAPGVASSGGDKLWEDNWDDDDIEDEFSVQLRRVQLHFLSKAFDLPEQKSRPCPRLRQASALGLDALGIDISPTAVHWQAAQTLDVKGMFTASRGTGITWNAVRVNSPKFADVAVTSHLRSGRGVPNKHYQYRRRKDALYLIAASKDIEVQGLVKERLIGTSSSLFSRKAHLIKAANCRPHGRRRFGFEW
ncbi:DSS1/SEM1 family-domain-containing protein [Melanogaster broomeanus]|nr:DSS1/SEM1 family-domain-containing protein [Melanogaster broomeanus]